MADTPGFKFDVGSGEDLEVGGWDAIAGIGDKEQRDRQFQQMLDHSTMYRQAFSTPAGRYVLQDLMDGYLKQRIVNPDQTERHDAIRQGAADMVQRILYLIEFANTGGGRPTGQSQPEE